MLAVSYLGALLRGLLEGVANLNALSALHGLRDKLVVDVFVNEGARPRGAALALHAQKTGAGGCSGSGGGHAEPFCVVRI